MWAGRVSKQMPHSARWESLASTVQVEPVGAGRASIVAAQFHSTGLGKQGPEVFILLQLPTPPIFEE